ncbi:MAG: cupin domain-containing protein [Silicimonas sp.]|nr:cupin domain-containing protein [Silicimonas sp.]
MSGETYLLTAETIAALAPEMRSHFLNNNARRTQKSLARSTGLNEIDFAIIEVAPGDESTEHHKHHHEEECLYVLEGEGVARIGAASHAVKSGDFIGYPAGGLAHSLHNTGSTPLRCISVSQRKAHDVSDYPRKGKRLFRNKDLTWNMVDLSVIDRPFGSKT